MLGFANAQTGAVVTPHGNVDPIADAVGDAPDPVCGDGAQRHFIKARRQQIRYQRGLGAGKHHISDTPLPLGLHQHSPSCRIENLRGMLFVPFEIVTPLTTELQRWVIS